MPPELLSGYDQQNRFKECDSPAPSIMEGFLLCNGDETLVIVEPTGDTIAVLEAHWNGLHKEPWNNGGGRRSIPYLEKTAHILKKVFLLHRPLVIDMKMFYY